MFDLRISKSKRTAAGIIGLMVLIVVAFSSVYIARESDHVCHEEECPVCACLHLCEDMLHQLGSGLAGVVVVTVSLVFCAVSALLPVFDLVSETLVTRKVRLND